MSGEIVVLYPTGDTLTAAWSKKGPPDLETLQRLVGGYIQPITVRWKERTRRAYVDEDGLSKGQRYNAYGSELTGHMLVGNVVIWIPGSTPKKENRDDPCTAEPTA